jgi:hypothetical protein
MTTFLRGITQRMHTLLNGMLLQKVIYFFEEDMTWDEKEKHYTTLKNYIWKTIKELAERVAFKKK